MKGLTLTQPWASLVAIGAKTIETRGWSTSYRGELLIASSKKFPTDCRVLCFQPPFTHPLIRAGFNTTSDLPLGLIVAVAELAEVVETESVDTIWRMRESNATRRLWPNEHPEREFGDYGPRRFAWRLANVRRLPTAVPAFHVDRHGQARPGGALGLWSVPQVVLDLVAGQGVL